MFYCHFPSYFYHSCSEINFNWFLHLSTDLFTLTLTLSITFVSPSFSSAIGFDSKDEIRPEPKKSSSINKWLSGLLVDSSVRCFDMIS